MFKRIKKFFDLGLYTVDQVKVFVLKGVITEKQYKEITGEEYSV